MVVEGKTRGIAKGIGAMTLFLRRSATTFLSNAYFSPAGLSPIIATRVLLTARSGYYVPQWSGNENSKRITLRYETSSETNKRVLESPYNVVRVTIVTKRKR